MGLRAVERKAVESFARQFPNSVIADLIMHFSKETVVKLIELYSGRQITLPTISSVWISHRNKMIKEELDKDN